MSAWLRYSGLFVAPAAWAANVQAGQLLSYIDCSTRTSWSTLTAALALALALAAAAASLARRNHVAGTGCFLANLGGLVALTFAFALMLQMAATLMLDPCAR